MSTLEPVAFLSRLQRCFKRMDSFFTERGEAMRKIGAQNLQNALPSRHMKQFPTSTFTCILLELYGHHLVAEQKQALAVWEEQLCGEAVRVRPAENREDLTARLVRVQEFFRKFADEIVILQKPNLRRVVMSNQAHKHTEWMQAQHFFSRDYVFLTVEERNLLEDWESVCFVTPLHWSLWLFCPGFRDASSAWICS